MKVSELIDLLAEMPPDATVQRYYPEDDLFREHYEDLREVRFLGFPKPHVEMAFE